MRIYDTPEWKKLRKQVLREEPHCHYCPERSTTVDHILEAALYPHLAFTRSNLRALCATCHNKRTGRSSRNPMRKRPMPTGHDAQGRPLDRSHPWNR